MISYIDNKKANLIKFTDNCVIMSDNMVEKIGINQLERKYKKLALDANLVFRYENYVRNDFGMSEMKMNKIRKGLYKLKISKKF